MPSPLAYTIIKSVHQTTALISISGFLLRGIWMLRQSPQLQHRLTKRLPHINDTLFLISGISLAALIGQYPFIHAWLTVKVIGLLIYIVLGAIALHYGRSKTQQACCLLLALLAFTFVASVAISKNPWGIGAWL